MEESWLLLALRFGVQALRVSSAGRVMQTNKPAAS